MPDLIQEKLTNFFSKYPRSTFKKGATLIRPDDPISKIYYIKKGIVRQYSISENGEEITVNLFRPQSFIPIMIALSGANNRYYFEAKSEVETWQAPTNQTIKFLKQEPEVLFDLVSRFAMAINGLSLKYEDLATKNAQQRILALLTYLSEKFDQIELTHQEIANWTGVTRETASRTIGQLTKAGLINNSHHHFRFVSQITDKKPLLS